MLQNARTSAKPTSRAALIRSGLELLTENGFGNTGLDEILKHAKVPKGSFYHHFSSKNEFALVLIAEYNNYFRRRIDRMLSAESGRRHHGDRPNPRADPGSRPDHGQASFPPGCLIGNFSQELGVQYEDFRRRLEAVFLEWETILAAALNAESRTAASRWTSTPNEAAAFFWTGWEGAVMRAKVSVSAKPLEDFGATFINMIKSKQG